jgi:hypothetical protein
MMMDGCGFWWMALLVAFMFGCEIGRKAFSWIEDVEIQAAFAQIQREGGSICTDRLGGR